MEYRYSITALLKTEVHRATANTMGLGSLSCVERSRSIIVPYPHLKPKLQSFRQREALTLALPELLLRASCTKGRLIRSLAHH